MKSLQILMMNNSQRSKYGYLYNYTAINNANFPHVSMRVPTITDYNNLITEVGSSNAGDLKETGTTFWQPPNTGSTNITGFTAYGGGLRDQSGDFTAFGQEGCYWAASSGDQLLWLLYSDTTIYIYNYSPEFGMSSRLCSDTNPGITIVDYDGNIYDIVQIGSLYWTVQNWKCTKLNDGTPLTLVESAATWATNDGAYYCAYNNNYTLV